MKNIGKFMLVGVAVLLLAVLIIPVVAQDKPAPGEGGVIIEGNFGGDVASMNPILASDTASQRVYSLMFPNFIGANVETAEYVKDDPMGMALAKDWTVSDDGLIYTFTLRDDWKWSDGTPMSSADVLYTWKAYQAAAEGIVDSPGAFILDQIASVEAPDAQTVVVTMKEASCAALGNIGVLYPVPSHILPEDVAQLNDAEFNLNPSVSFGPFNFGEFRPGEQVGLVASQNYFAPVTPTGFVYKNVPDQTVLIEQFLAGETNVIDNPAVNRRSDVRAAGDLQVYPFPGNAWDYLMLNHADPTNPQNGQDENGNPIDQGHHPLFGDVRVRQAIQRAIDVDAIIQGAVFGEGTRMTSGLIPASWAYATDLAPIPYDVEAAKQLLDEAGFVDDDNNPDTPRVAKGALYAPDGTPFRFTLYTNEGNTRRGAVGTIVQDQLKQLGLEVDFQAIDFNTLLDIMDGQTFDAVILGWRQGWPDDPDLTQIFTPAGDVVGGGSNNMSYYNPEVIKLNQEGRSLPGCDQTERAKIYHKIQEIMQEDLPYIWLFAIDGMYAANGAVEGFGPYPSNLYWNVESWALATP